jgi:hypothetical protein
VIYVGFAYAMSHWPMRLLPLSLPNFGLLEIVLFKLKLMYLFAAKVGFTAKKLKYIFYFTFEGQTLNHTSEVDEQSELQLHVQRG